MNRRQIINASIVFLGATKNTFACNSWGVVYVVDPELNIYIQQSEKSYTSLDKFLDDKFGESSWIMSDRPSPGVSVNDLGHMDKANFIDRWRGIKDSLYLQRDFGYPGPDPRYVRANLKYETEVMSKMEVNFFLEIKNARERWGVGSISTQYIWAAKFVLAPEASLPVMSLRMPNDTNIILTLKKENLPQVLIAQPMLVRNACPIGPIGVGTQELADKLNTEEKDWWKQQQIYSN